MSSAKTITLYLHPELRKGAEARRMNIVNRIAAAVAPSGYELAFRDDSRANRLASVLDPGLSIFHREDPFHPRALTLRQVYHPPFWTLERSAKRWEWAVAQSRFVPEKIDPDTAQSFCDRWRKRLFEGWEAKEQGHIYVPLQGRIREKRSFQSCSPIDMLKTVLSFSAGRPVVATLHPRESYSDEDKAALDALSAPNLRIAAGEMARWLPGARYVVTQNSSAAFNGYFFAKPAILFGQIDFHHIALNAAALRAKAAFAQVERHDPDYDRYLFWFWQRRAINAGHATAEDRILNAMRRGGWDL
ncbi:MAG: hypothetical protein AAFZ02_09765 [Pseudomonadota bacterium]